MEVCLKREERKGRRSGPGRFSIMHPPPLISSTSKPSLLLKYIKIPFPYTFDAVF